VKNSSFDVGQIPEKKYFRIGEVSKLVGVDPHVLRYWESEFKTIRPHRAKSKQRLYRRKDVETLLWVKALLHNEGYTISGARKVLKESGKGSKNTQQPQKSLALGSVHGLHSTHLALIKKELLSILNTIEKKESCE